MKILHIITSLQIGGAEKLMLDILPRFRDMGNDVELLLFSGVPTSFKQQLLDEGIKITELSPAGSVYNPMYIYKLRKYFKEFDIIHTHNTSPQYYTALAHLITKGRAKLVTTEHNTHNRRREICGWKFIDRFIYKQYDSIITISKQTEDNLVRFISGNLNIVTIENGIDLEKYENVKYIDKIIELQIPHNIVLVTQVAGFREQKDQDTLIRSLKYLPDTVHVVFCGDGVRLGDCKELAHKLGVQNKAHFIGTRTDIPSILKASDIIVMSSHYEGLSLSSVEGMAVGKPMIASSVEGLREVVGGAGVLFKQGDEKALAKEIMRLVDDKDYYSFVSNKCKNRAKKYDISIMVEKYYNVYLRLLNR